MTLNIASKRKNEETELDEPCECYRNYIDLAYNFEHYRVSFCKHWKDYFISRDILKENGRNYSHNEVNEAFIEKLLSILNFYGSKSHYCGNVVDVSRTGITYKDIETDKLCFYEPLCYRPGRYDFVRYWHKISLADFYKKLVECTPENLLNYAVYFPDVNPIDIDANSSFHNLYYRELKNFQQIINEISKKVIKKKYANVGQQIQLFLNLKIKQHETSK